MYLPACNGGKYSGLEKVVEDLSSYDLVSDEVFTNLNAYYESVLAAATTDFLSGKTDSDFPRARVACYGHREPMGKESEGEMAADKALLVIDMQNDYLWDKRKPMFSYDTDKLTSEVNHAISTYKENGYDIIYIKHVLSRILWGVGFSIKGTEGAELFSGVDRVSDLIFEKSHPDAYTAKAFRQHMEKRGYKEVVLCGLDECGCVGATAKGAAKTGIRVFMLTDSIGRRFPDKKVQKMRTELKALGVSYI